jgi:hypothetical protein
LALPGCMVHCVTRARQQFCRHQHHSVKGKNQ